MFSIRYLTIEDKEFWFSLDKRATEQEFLKRVHDRQGYILFEQEKPVGIMHFTVLWDNLPFLNLLYIKKDYRGKGGGKFAMHFWEKDMQKFGYKMVLLSTRSDEGAQHFYRKIGYQDCGCLVLKEPPFQQPMEMFFSKTL